MVSETTTVDELLEACDTDALSALAPVELAHHAEAFFALWARLDAARLRVISALDAAEAYRVDGCRDLASWLAWEVGERRGTARRDTELAAAVAAMPVVRPACVTGRCQQGRHAS
jgi:hypothetical protein